MITTTRRISIKVNADFLSLRFNEGFERERDEVGVLVELIVEEIVE